MSQQISVDWTPPRPALPLQVGGLMAVGVARALVHFFPLARVGEVLGRMQCGTHSATHQQAEAAVILIRRSSMRAAAGRDSSIMSVAAVLVCLCHRTTVQWRVGLRTPPMEMHAWIEADGRAVGERLDVMSAYPTIVASN